MTKILSALTDFSGINPGVLARKAAIGTAVHYACELFDEDDLDWSSLDETLTPYVRAWADFREKTGFVPQTVEELVFHPTMFYAGQRDRTGQFQGERCVIDIKTCAVLKPTIGLQLAAYAAAPVAGETTVKEPITRRFALQQTKAGKFKLQEYADSMDFPTFLSLRTMLNYSDKHKIRINYEPQC